MAKYYKNHKVIFIMHIFNEWPAAYPKLVQIGAKVKTLGSPISIVPAEFQLHHEDQLHYGFWNNKPKMTVAVHWNI